MLVVVVVTVTVVEVVPGSGASHTQSSSCSQWSVRPGAQVHVRWFARRQSPLQPTTAPTAEPSGQLAFPRSVPSHSSMPSRTLLPQNGTLTVLMVVVVVVVVVVVAVVTVTGPH